MDLIDIYERSISRKNSEIEVIKVCLDKEKTKLKDEKEELASKLKKIKQIRLD